MVFFSLLPYTTIFDAIGPSRKDAFWLQPLTQKRTLRFPRSYKLRFLVTLEAQSHCRMCLSMRDRPQTVGQMPGCFTEKYILHRRAYEKDALCDPCDPRVA